LTKAFIGVDFDGTIVSQAVANEANKRWYAYYADVLGDESVGKLAGAAGDDFLPNVLEIMTRIKGKKPASKAEESAYLREAREAYATLKLEIIANDRNAVFQQDVVKELALAKRHGAKFALISTSFTDVIEPALTILGVRDVFDVIVATAPDERLPKRTVIERFFAQRGVWALAAYVGNSDEDETACRQLGVPFYRVVEGHTDVQGLREFLATHAKVENESRKKAQ